MSDWLSATPSLSAVSVWRQLNLNLDLVTQELRASPLRYLCSQAAARSAARERPVEGRATSGWHGVTSSRTGTRGRPATSRWEGGWTNQGPITRSVPSHNVCNCRSWSGKAFLIISAEWLGRFCAALISPKTRRDTLLSSEHRVHVRKLSGEKTTNRITTSNKVNILRETTRELLLNICRRDIARTYPEHDFFKKKGGVGQESLFNVMKAYSIHDREVCHHLLIELEFLQTNFVDRLVTAKAVHLLLGSF